MATMREGQTVTIRGLDFSEHTPEVGGVETFSINGKTIEFEVLNVEKEEELFTGKITSIRDEQ